MNASIYAAAPGAAAPLSEHVPLKPAEALRVLREAAKALAEGHKRGTVHGAVCAGNVFVDEALNVTLFQGADAPHRSPEQEQGALPDARSDVYCLGVTIAGALADAAEAPEPLTRLLGTMMEEEPARRYQSMAEVLMALEVCEVMTGTAEAAQPRRHLLAISVLVLVAAMLLLAWLFHVGVELPTEGGPPKTRDVLKTIPLKTRGRPSQP